MLSMKKWKFLKIFIIFILLFLNKNLIYSEEVKKKPIFILLKEDHLKNIREEVEKLKNTKISAKEQLSYKDIRCIFHCHSNLSHDSPGTVEDIIKGAKENNIQAIFISEHPSDKVNIFTQGLKGNKNGVIFFPGGETRGFLVYPKPGIDEPKETDQQKYVDNIVKNGGLIFISHPDEERDWSLKHLTGMEIYNTHADFKDEEGLINVVIKKLLKGLTQNSKEVEIIQEYKQEMHSIIFDEPIKFLKIFDDQCKKRKFVGIAANDTHSNIGVIIKKIDEEKVEIFDVLGENKFITLPISSLVEPFQSKAKNCKVGEKITEIKLDPYEVSFKYVSTHIFVKKIKDEEILDAVKNGAIYISFDWLLSPEGFSFYLEDKNKKYITGSEIKFKQGMKLKIFAPSSSSIIKLIKDGKKIKEEKNSPLEYPLKEKGIYRVEVFLPFLDTERAWIYSNPIYVK